MTDPYPDLYGDFYGGTTNVGFRIEVDWNKDGDFSDPLEDVTSYVLSGPGVSVQYGRDQVTALAPTVSGSGSLTLKNETRRFSPLNTAGPLYGLLKPARPVRIQRDIAGGTFTLFRGHSDDEPLNPDQNSPTVALTLLDSLADFRGQTISTPLYSGIRTGEAIGYVLDACGWPATARDLDAGATHVPWWWEDGTDALTALENLIRSEGPPALLTMGADGEVVFRDRHHRLTAADSLTSQQTWTASGPLAMNLPFSYDPSWRNIVNAGTASIGVRMPQQLQEVWTSDATITLSAGEQKLVTASASDPFYGAVPPVSGTDYTLVSGSVTATLLRTSGASATILLTSVGVASVITGLRLRAQPVTVAYTVQVSAEDSASIAEYGRRSFPGDLPWCNAYDAEAVLSTAVAQRAHPLPILKVRFMVGRDTVKAAVIARNLGDRVTVVEPETGINGAFYIESIEHQFSGEYDHAVTFGLEAAAVQVSPVFRTDTAGAGADQGYLGNPYVDTENLLICDSNVPGHRPDEAVAAA